MATRVPKSNRNSGKDKATANTPLARKVQTVQSTRKQTEITNAFKASQRGKRKTVNRPP